MKFLRYGLVLSSLLITSLLSAGYAESIIVPSKSLALKNVPSVLLRIKSVGAYDALMVKLLFGEAEKPAAYLHMQKEDVSCLEDFATNSEHISAQDVLDAFFAYIEKLIVEIQGKSLDESKVILQQCTKEFKSSIMDYFSKFALGHQETEYFKINLCNAVSRANPVLFINLITMYKDILATSGQKNISADVLKVIKSKKSYNASLNIKSKLISQIELSESVLDWDNDAFLYAYSRSTDIDQQKDIVLYLIENNKLTHAAPLLFLTEYGSDKQVAQDNSTDLKEVLEAIVAKLQMFEESRLCSHEFVDILIKAKKAAELIGNDPLVRKMYAKFNSKILIKDDHIKTGDIRSGTPRGLHVFPDEKILLEDLENDPLVERRDLPDVRVDSPDKKMKTSNLCISDTVSYIYMDKASMVYNPNNGTICSSVFAEQSSCYSFDLNEEIKKRNVPIAQNVIKDAKLSKDLGDVIAKKLHLEECEIKEAVGNNVICLGKSIKKKGHTTSFYDKKFNSDMQSLFKLIASAVDGYPIWSKNVSLDIDGKVLGIENISKNSGVICVVSDADGDEHVIEIYFKAHKKYPSLVTVVSAFEHAFPFVYETENLPEAIAIGPDLGTTCHLLPNAMSALNSKVSTLVKTGWCKGEFPSLSGTCIPLCNIKLSDYYQGMPDGFCCDVSFLARIPENKMEELYAQWGNENYLRLALKDYSDFPTIVELKNMLLKENETEYCLLKGSKLDTLRNMIHAFIVSCSAQLKERKGNALLEMYFDNLSQFVETPRYHCNMKKLLLAISKPYRDKLLVK